MDRAPMYLIGAKRTELSALRIVFVIPDPEKMHLIEGTGALLEVENFSDISFGGTDNARASLIEAYFETLIEGDDEHEGHGPLPCGIGISGDEVQIVDYESGDLIFRCHGDKMIFLTKIDISEVREKD